MTAVGVIGGQYFCCFVYLLAPVGLLVLILALITDDEPTRVYVQQPGYMPQQQYQQPYTQQYQQPPQQQDQPQQPYQPPQQQAGQQQYRPPEQ